MTNANNLRSDFTAEERSENGRKGGTASGQARRRQRTFRESINALLKCDAPDEELRSRLEQLGVDATVLNAIHMAVHDKAMRGDLEAAKYLRDTAGEKPRDGLDIAGDPGKPLSWMDLSAMSDDQLRALIAKGEEEK